MTEGKTPDARSDGPFTRASIRHATLGGVRWYSLVRVISESSSLLVSILLARLIAPGQFGSVAISFGVLGITTTVFGAALTTPLVQRREAGPEEFETVSFLAFAAAAVLVVTFVAFLPLVAEPLFGSRTTDFIQLSSIGFPCLAVSAVPQARLQRRLSFRRLSAMDLTSGLSGSAVSVVAAVLGAGGEAIILGFIVTVAVQAFLASISAPLARPRLHRDAARSLLSFGAPAGLSSTVFAIYQNVDYMVLGARLGAVEVGFYWRAFQLGIEYQGKLSRIMLQLAFPVYSRLQDLDAIKRMRARIVRVHAAALFPLLALLAAVAPVLIPFIYGDRWTAAVLPTQLLCIAGLAAVVGTGGGPLMLAVGKPRLLLVINALTMTVFAAVIYLVAPLGVIDVCLAVVAYQVTTVASVQILIERVLGIGLRALAIDIVPALVGAIVIFVGGLPLTTLLTDVGMPPVVVLGIVGLAACVAYVGILRTFFRPAWDDLLLVVRTVVAIKPRRFSMPVLRRRRGGFENVSEAEHT
jgi:lipopolysaccharide exporter